MTKHSEFMMLSRREVEAIHMYVWDRVRATNGEAYKVWQKMFEFLEDKQPGLLDTLSQDMHNK